MLRDITIGQHFPGNSLVHRFDPRLKILLTILYIVLLFAAANPLGLALSIAWLAVDYAVRRRPWAFFGIVLLAFSFHNSAIVFAPFYFVPQRKMDKNSVIALMVTCGVVGLIGTTDALFSQFGSLSGSEARTETYTNFTPRYFMVSLISNLNWSKQKR